MAGKYQNESELSGRLSHVIDLRIPGYLGNIAPGSVAQLAFHKTSSEKWYSEFVRRIVESIGKSFFPVYRMADGEFIFCVGWTPVPPGEETGRATRVSRRFRGGLSRLLRRFGNGNRTIWGENYSGMNQDKLRDHYIRCLKEVSSHGYLAVHFTKSPGRFSEEYFKPMCHWFEENSIELHAENYTSFYHVYALLCGPDFPLLIRGRSLLVVTSAGDQKKEKITRYLHSRGAREIQYLKISPQRALLDRIRLEELSGPVDIAFVAGGIGSVNILDQLKPLNTVCIDIGICLEIFADPSKRGRAFTLPDEFIG